MSFAQTIAIAGVLAWMVMVAPEVRAQVNTELLRARIHDKGMSLVLQGTFDGHTGNTSGLTAAGFDARVVKRTRRL